ncbi:hypothetical protein JOC95_002038 [Bacillus tianshenii]|uniref:Uncharacterized protein n=1 Tax=Sutcliffiella tianshenii TaxID=1463404 RepID=A0ABS2NZN8_9BACI|nr:hypothetical protein [Bacillus tianshenii]MBM7620185.1 hypothetical protein [Bacillus tianshenii]
MDKVATKKKKPIKITVQVLNQPSHETIVNTARILKTLGTSA